MSLDQSFQQAATDVQQLSEKPDNDTLLKLYSLYKQATEGEVSGKRPGMLNMVARAKFDAWANLKGTSSDEAKNQYIELVTELKSTH